MEQKRIEWLDLAKVLTMFFVIFDHLGLKNSLISDWVCGYFICQPFFDIWSIL